MDCLLDFASNVSPPTLILTGLLASVVIYWLFSSTNHKNLPPGPLSLPIVGYFPFLGNKPYEKFDQLGKKYGPVFSLYLGQYLTVVLTDFKSVKEAYTKDEFLGRPEHSLFNFFDKEFQSFSEYSGETWKEQRRTALHIFRDLGLGRSVMEEHILEEISEVMDRFKSTKGQPFDMKKILFPSMSNNITALVFGERFSPSDERRKLLDSIFINEHRGTFNMVHPLVFMPWLVKIIKAFGLFGIAEAKKTTDKARGFFRKSIAEHKATLDENNTRDYIDGFLAEMKKKKGQKSSFDDDMLVGNCFAFFGAGSETVSVSISWLMIIMATYPDVQSRVQKEIDDVIGDRTPQWKDNLQMPYVLSVIAEMHRWATVVPINLPRCTLADTTVGGYSIPKGTIIFSNFYSLNKDPKMWKDPETFDPQRFYKKKVEQLIPFSYGKRTCPGEGLAHVEVFLYFVSFMQNFTVSLPEGVKPDFDFILEIASIPKMGNFCFTERKK